MVCSILRNIVSNVDKDRIEFEYIVNMLYIIIIRSIVKELDRISYTINAIKYFIINIKDFSTMRKCNVGNLVCLPYVYL